MTRARRSLSGLRRSPSDRRARGFTLIEILLVVGILAIILAMGVPPMARLMQKEPLRQAASDVMEALAQARAQSILHGVPAEFILGVDLADKAVAVTVALVPSPSDGLSRGGGGSGAARGDSDRDAVPQKLTMPFQARLPNDVRVTFLDVNFTDQMKSTDEDVRVRFFANGTSDDFTIVLEDRAEKRKVSLDPVTGLASMEVSR